MRSYTLHTRLGEPPELVAEGFAWGALVFGPFWLLARGAALPGLLGLCVAFLFAVLPAPYGSAALPVLMWGFGLFGHDLRRWSLARRGYALAGVIRARSQEDALARLFAERRELMAEALAT